MEEYAGGLRRRWLGLALLLTVCSLPMCVAQTELLHANGPLPSYEVATIKPADKSMPAMGGFVGSTKWLIELAYNIPAGSGNRVIGGPEWIDSDLYVIVGKVSSDQFVKQQSMTRDQRLVQNQLMRQSLLADRFKLKAHFERRQMPIYELVVAKGGSKLTPAKNAPTDPGAMLSSSAPPPPGPLNPANMQQGLTVRRKGQGSEMTVKGMTLDAALQGGFLGLNDRPIVNKTGLTDLYDFTLDWTSDQGAGAQADGTVPAGDGPSIFTAMQEQLGLKLVPAKGSVEVIVIDSIERPTAN